MNEKTREILTRPFPKELIRTRQGPGEKLLSYIEIQHVLDRLNEAFEHDWSYRLVRREQFEDQVVVEVSISAAEITKTGLGGSNIRRGSGDGRILSLADDFKAAEADALKRAARSLGMLAELYLDEPAVHGAANNNQVQVQHHQREAPRTSGRITSAQLSKIEELVKELGSDFQSYREWVRKERSISVEYSDRRLASELISDLLDRLRRKRGFNGSAQLAEEGSNP